jgi:hypothetical protein
MGDSHQETNKIIMFPDLENASIQSELDPELKELEEGYACLDGVNGIEVGAQLQHHLLEEARRIALQESSVVSMDMPTWTA